MDFDLSSGRYGDGRLVYGNKTELSSVHPDTGVAGEGGVDSWEELRSAIYDVSLRLGPVEYMGYDVCETTDGPKIMEINSHSGSKYLQLYKPFMQDDFLSDYFSRKIAAVEALEGEDLARRNGIMR